MTRPGLGSLNSGGGCLKVDDKGGFQPGDGSSYVPIKRAPAEHGRWVDQASSSTASPFNDTFCTPQVIVRSAAAELEVRNVLILNATREAGTLAFQPAYGTGEYHLYFLPHSSHDPTAQTRSQNTR